MNCPLHRFVAFSESDAAELVTTCLEHDIQNYHLKEPTVEIKSEETRSEGQGLD